MNSALAVDAGWARPEPSGRRRWIACAALAAAAHLALAWILTRQPEPVRAPGAAPPAVLVDLAPPPAPPPAPSVDLPVPELPELTPPEPAPPEPVVELPPPELPPPPELVVPEPPLPEAPPDAAVLPRPRAKPTPPPRQLTRPDVAAPEIVPPDAAPTPVAPATAPAPPQAEPAAAAPPSYQGLLLRHLERHKRYPRSARLRREEGIAQLRFTMDRAGNVLGFRLVSSSGHESLDAEVTAMLERAAPLPPLPAEMPQARLELIVPVAFELR